MKEGWIDVHPPALALRAEMVFDRKKLMEGDLHS